LPGQIRLAMTKTPESRLPAGAFGSSPLGRLM
jgi:hypothetical protein